MGDGGWASEPTVSHMDASVAPRVSPNRRRMWLAPSPAKGAPSSSAGGRSGLRRRNRAFQRGYRLALTQNRATRPHITKGIARIWSVL